MTGDDAREKFSAAFDGELDEAERVAFDEALNADAELKEEYEEFASLLRETSALGVSDEAPPPDLLAGVQTKLRARSRGKFYRDRFSEKSGAQTLLPVLAGAGTLVLLALCYWAMHAIVIAP